MLVYKQESSGELRPAVTKKAELIHSELACLTKEIRSKVLMVWPGFIATYSKMRGERWVEE